MTVVDSTLTLSLMTFRLGGPKDVRYLRSARNALSGGTAASTRQDFRLDHAVGGGKLL